MSHLTEQYEVESGEKALYRVGASDYHTLRYVKWLEAKVAELTSTNSTMDAIAALADRWCDATNQPTSICVALYEFTTWARQQHQ